MDSRILFGTARRTITPKVPCSLAGYFNLRFWDSVLDDLEVRVLVLKQENCDFLLVQFDLITVPDTLYTQIMHEISDLRQFSEQNVMITATHTHTAPDLDPPSSGCNPEYLAATVKATADAIREAAANLRKGSLFTGLAEDSRFEFNRRFWMKDGTVTTNPGKLNPAIARPEGAVDYEIPIFGIKSEAGYEVVLANIVNHTDTTDGTAVSADWAGHTHRLVEKNMTGRAPIMFPLIGCAGNINHFDVSTSMNQTSPAEAKRIGEGYAETISAALAALTPSAEFVMRTVFAEVFAKPVEIPEADVAEAMAVMEKYAEIPDPLKSSISITSEDLADETPVALKYFAASLLKIAKDRTPFRFRLTGVVLGSAMIASLPSEPFVEIGLDIRKRFFAGKLCMVVSHCNGTGNSLNGEGYIPNYWNYKRGGYETTPTSNPFEMHLASFLREKWADLSLDRSIFIPERLPYYTRSALNLRFQPEQV